MFLLYIVILFVTISTVKSEGGAICDCQDVGLFKDIVKQVLIEQQLETAKISRLEERLKAYERTGPIPNDRLEKLEQNVKDISIKLNESVTEAKNKHKGFNRGIGAIVQKALISEKIERTKLVSNMNKLVNEQKNTIETFKEAINNTIDKRFQDIKDEHVVYKDSIETFKVAINKTIDKRFQDIKDEHVVYKDSIETFKVAINKTIDKGFQDITAKQVDYKAAIETYKEAINKTIDKRFQDIAAEQMEYKDTLETFKVAINNTMDKHFQDITAEQVVYKDTIETYKVAINNTIDERFEYINAKQVKYKYEIKEVLDDTAIDTASFIKTVFNNISIFKDKLMTDVNGTHNSIKELNNDIQRISSNIVSVNQSVGQNRNIVHILSKQVKENREWEQWSSWGECSELCGAGLRERVRTCASPFGCIGNSKDFKICHIETCKVRLVGGLNKYEGRLEVWHNESWGTVCDDGFTTLSASVVCKMLNYPHTNPLVLGSAYFGAGTVPIHLDNVQCTGTEISLTQCQHEGFGSHNCHHGEDVGISCTPGIRLVNGSNQYEGRLEVWHDNSWGTVCDDDFTALSATVVCKMLNYPHNNPLVFKSAYFGGAGKVPIHLYDVACTGTEISLLDCPHRSWGLNDCSHGRDVGISCTQVRLVGGSNKYEGRLEVWHNESWGTVCDDMFTALSASVVCKMLNYQHTNPLVFGSAFFGEGTLPIHLDNVQCTGTEISLPQCQHYGFGTHNCGHGEDVGISCTPVRLVNGSNQYDGRLEVWHDNSWGTVCDDDFTALSATVVCKMLNYPHNNPLVFKSAYFGAGKVPIHLDDVACTGTEISLLQCPHRRWGSNDCSHGEDVGISCTQVRLVGGSNKYEGRLEVWHNESWGTVCDDGFTTLSASVVCKMLNYPHTDSLVFGSAFFGEGTLPIHLDDVQCTGTEISLPQCQHRGFGTHNCGHGEDVGISCTPVRLVNGSNQYEGRLEVWHDGIWGTVCDDYFDVLAAKVVCKLLNYRHPVPRVFGASHFGAGILSTLLTNVRCTGSETSLLQCSHNGWGLQACINDEHVGLACK